MNLVRALISRDIEVVIQFGVPCSLSVFKQRIGRAGRSPDIQARAILLVGRENVRSPEETPQEEDRRLAV